MSDTGSQTSEATPGTPEMCPCGCGRQQVWQKCEQFRVANTTAVELCPANPDRTAVILSVDGTGPCYFSFVSVDASNNAGKGWFPFYNGNFFRLEGSLARRRISAWQTTGGNLNVGLIQEFGHADMKSFPGSLGQED